LAQAPGLERVLELGLAPGLELVWERVWGPEPELVQGPEPELVWHRRQQ